MTAEKSWSPRLWDFATLYSSFAAAATGIGWETDSANPIASLKSCNENVGGFFRDPVISNIWLAMLTYLEIIQPIHLMGRPYYLLPHLMYWAIQSKAWNWTITASDPHFNRGKLEDTDRMMENIFRYITSAARKPFKWLTTRRAPHIQFIGPNRYLIDHLFTLVSRKWEDSKPSVDVSKEMQ